MLIAIVYQANSYQQQERSVLKNIFKRMLLEYLTLLIYTQQVKFHHHYQVYQLLQQFIQVQHGDILISN